MKRLFIGLLLCCGLTAQAQLTFVLSGSQTKAYGDGSGLTNIAGVTPYTNNNNAAGWIVGNGIGTNVVATSNDSYIFTNAAAGGLRFTNDFGLGAFETGGTASYITSTGLVTTLSDIDQGVYGYQTIYYQGIEILELATGSLLDGSGNAAVQPQSRVLNGNWNAQGNLDVDGDLNVDGTMTVTDLIVTNIYTGITNATGLSTDADGKLSTTSTPTVFGFNGAGGAVLSIGGTTVRHYSITDQPLSGGASGSTLVHCGLPVAAPYTITNFAPGLFRDGSLALGVNTNFTVRFYTNGALAFTTHILGTSADRYLTNTTASVTMMDGGFTNLFYLQYSNNTAGNISIYPFWQFQVIK